MLDEWTGIPTTRERWEPRPPRRQLPALPLDTVGLIGSFVVNDAVFKKNTLRRLALGRLIGVCELSEVAG